KALGVVLIIYGFHFVRPLPFGLLAKEFGLRLPRGESSNFGALLLGGAFGLAWTPCSGVILGVILAQALFFQAASSAALLFSYSGGLILPMIVLALIYQRSGQFIKLPSRVAKYYLPLVGIVIIILGLSLLTGWIDYWRGNLLQIFPNLESGLLPLSR
ncbi:MAG TPA: cytochrome c biogenesis protein CcdA, partial [Patescibacteria group bacterium]|nr:cytochrome c biogenesis protein CcdA [Patescibacteria group bacterium]